MNWFWMNMPAALVFAGLWAGIPMWLVLKRPDRGPASLAVQSPARTRQQRRPSRRSPPPRSAAGTQ